MKNSSPPISSRYWRPTSEASTQFQQDALDVALLSAFSQAKEIEDIRIFQSVTREIGLGGWEVIGEICHGVARARMRHSLDLHDQHASRPAMFEGFLSVPEPLWCVVELVEQGDDVGPRQLCNGLLHKFRLRKCLGQRAHVLEVARRESTHVGKRCLEIPRQPVDNSGAPALSQLSFDNVPADLPV